MGNFPSKKKSKLSGKDVRILTEKIRLLRDEINGMMQVREKERKAYEREVVLFAFKEAEWKQERNKLKEEVKRLMKKNKKKKKQKKKKNLEEEEEEEEEEEKTRVIMTEEIRAQRDEAVEKWKQLYLAIKTELDDLIQITHGNGLYWRTEEDEMIQELKREVKVKEEEIEALKAQLGSVETEVQKKERDFDILRQSFKIMSCKKKPSSSSSSSSSSSPFGNCKSLSQKLHL